MTVRDVISSLEAKAHGYASLCAARDELQKFLPAGGSDACARQVEQESLGAAAAAGLPELDAAILLLLREIAVHMEYIALELRRGHLSVS